MHTTTRFSIITSLLLVPVVLAAGMFSQQTSAAPNDTPIHYVALGDSRAAAPTNLSVFRPDGCGRTSSSYPTVLASKLGATLTDKSCVAAKTDNILSTRQLTLYGFRELQINALTPDTDLVTMSIGGNDIGWSQFVNPCISTLPGIDKKCRDDAELQTSIDTALSDLQPKVERVLSEVKARAPQATVVLVGHGGLYDETGCAWRANYSDADGPVITGFFAEFNATLEAAASSHDVIFIDVDTPAQNGHDVCSGEQRWFNGDSSGSMYQDRHPTPLGSRAIADLIYDAL